MMSDDFDYLCFNGCGSFSSKEMVRKEDGGLISLYCPECDGDSWYIFEKGEVKR